VMLNPDDETKPIVWIDIEHGLLTFRTPTDTKTDTIRANRLDRFHILGLKLRTRYTTTEDKPDEP